MKALKTSTAAALIFALAPAAALAAAQYTFSDIDADGNLELSEAEFERVSRGAFQAWDQNADQRITEDELYGGLFAAWDTDVDGDIGEEEYRNGYTAWFGDDVEPTFSEVAGDDDVIGRDEFASGLRETDAMAGFDAGEDGVDWAAFHVAMFDVYDRDDDDALSQDDYAAFEDNRITGGEQTAAADTGNAGATDVERGEETAAIGQDAITPEEVIALPNWATDELYADGISVEFLLDEAEVFGPTGEEIGSIENVVFSRDGQVLSVVAELGGFLDMFDTHVNVPWDEVEYSAGEIVIPVTEENAEDYSVFKTGYLTAEGAAQETATVEDDLVTGPSAFRATDLIGDYARIRDDEAELGYADFGYVNDLVIRDGQLAAVVVNPSPGYGLGDPYYAYPYYGYARGPGAYYDMPYGEEDVAQAEPFEYDAFEE